MKKHTYIVKVLKPHAKAYNPDRLMTELVRNQILHLSVAERHLEERHQTGTDVHSIRTEREASEYIRHLTSKLHGTKRAKGTARKSRATKRKSASKVAPKRRNRS
jgi:hypothetical protein